jgi:hypothetical protein
MSEKAGKSFETAEFDEIVANKSEEISDLTPEGPGPDPFDLKSLAVAPGAVAGDSVGVTKALVVVPVGKPHRNSFVRVHQGTEYRRYLAIIDDREMRETFLLTPQLAAALPGDAKIVDMRTSITRRGDIFLWPVPVPSEDGRENVWNASQREAADRAEQFWVRLVANMALGAYDLYQAQGELPEPVWPEVSFLGLLRTAFGSGKLVDGMDHPLVNRLLGRN